MVCDYMVRTGLTGADSIESVARNLSLSSYYKRANRAQLSRRRLTKCTAGTERRRRRRHSENECRTASGFGLRIGSVAGIVCDIRKFVASSSSTLGLFIVVSFVYHYCCYYYCSYCCSFCCCCCCCCISFYLDFQFAAIDAEKGIWRVIK